MREDEQGRSYEKLGPGQQLYRVLESCTDPATLWGKIESGKWDWLGVQAAKRSGGKPTFWLGRPPTSRMFGTLSYVAKHNGPDGAPVSREHRVEIAQPTPGGSTPSEAHWPTPGEARADYASKLEQLKSASGSGLHRVSLYIDDTLEKREFIVRALPNRL